MSQTEKPYVLDENDPNIPILIRDGWTLQPDGSWLSSDKKAIFSRVGGRRMLTTKAPEFRSPRLRIA